MASPDLTSVDPASGDAPQQVTYETLDEGTIARIWLNRPEAQNAQSRTLLVQLDEAFGRAEADDAVRVVIRPKEVRYYVVWGGELLEVQHHDDYVDRGVYLLLAEHAIDISTIPDVKQTPFDAVVVRRQHV